jgi:alkanesulfonate monooxygenase SsuD/methylene tetrahydromethanopterin reductase-like flavin-dependent oxidoreductase (luciferase family)
VIRALHFGLTPWDYHPAMDAERLAAQGERSEALGFDSFWLPESHFAGETSNPSPLLLLAAVAARTRRIALATTSLLLTVRHPLHVAEEVAVLDNLSGGRVILGLGRGFQREMFEAFDVPVAEKRSRFEASLATLRDAWAGKPVVEGGGRAITISPLPVQKPHPPLWVAAFGPKALAQVGRLGLPYVASPIEPIDRLEANYAAHREEVERHHGEQSLPVPVMRTVFAHADVRVCARVHAGLSRQAAGLARSGAAAIRRAGTDDVDAWALVGEPARVADRIAHYRERIGVTHLVARVRVPGAETAETEAALENLSGLREQLG